MIFFNKQTHDVAILSYVLSVDGYTQLKKSPTRHLSNAITECNRYDYLPVRSRDILVLHLIDGCVLRQPLLAGSRHASTSDDIEKEQFNLVASLFSLTLDLRLSSISTACIPVTAYISIVCIDFSAFSSSACLASRCPHL
jgi:hypothetical protein